jgi:hypothetical protein
MGEATTRVRPSEWPPLSVRVEDAIFYTLLIVLSTVLVMPMMRCSVQKLLSQTRYLNHALLIVVLILMVFLIRFREQQPSQAPTSAAMLDRLGLVMALYAGVLVFLKLDLAMFCILVVGAGVLVTTTVLSQPTDSEQSQAEWARRGHTIRDLYITSQGIILNANVAVVILTVLTVLGYYVYKLIDEVYIKQTASLMTYILSTCSSCALVNRPDLTRLDQSVQQLTDLF